MAVGMSYKAFPSREQLLRELTWLSLRDSPPVSRIGQCARAGTCPIG
jgi:hypothetical protein